jgi:hypothetical protein
VDQTVGNGNFLINSFQKTRQIGFLAMSDLVQRLDFQIEAPIFDLANISAVESAQVCEVISCVLLTKSP